MNIIGSIKDNYNLYINKPLINNYELFSEEEIHKIEKELLEVYNDNASIIFTNSSYVFPYERLLDLSNTYKETNDYYKHNLRYYKRDYQKDCLLKQDVEKTNEELSIHYNILIELKQRYPENEDLLEYEKIKIKGAFTSNLTILKYLKKYINNNKELLNYNEKEENDIDYNNLKKYLNDYIMEFDKITNESEKSIDKSTILNYRIDLFFNSKEGKNYVINLIEEIRNLENRTYSDISYNPISEVNKMIEKTVCLKNYKNYWNKISTDYDKLLNLKYYILMRNPDENEINNLRYDYNADTVYLPLIKKDYYDSRYTANNDFLNFIREYVFSNNLSFKDIYRKYPFALTLFFAYYSDTIEDWFQHSMEQSSNIRKYLSSGELKNIDYLEEGMSRETYIYLASEEYAFCLLEFLHIDEVNKKGLNWPLLKGIREIKFNDSKSSERLLELFNYSKNITISRDVKSLTFENIEFSSGNIIFQDGTEEVEMINSSFKERINITISKSIKKLDLDFKSGNISTLIFEDYNQSILMNKEFVKKLVNHFYYSNDERKIKQIIGKQNNEMIEYTFTPIQIIDKEKDRELIEEKIKQTYIEICKKFQIEEVKDNNVREDLDKNINLTNDTLNISPSRSYSLLKRKNEELQLMSEITGAKVLYLGCGERESLDYLHQKGAKEVWELNKLEKNIKYIPNNYYDYILSIYNIENIQELKKLFQDVYKYLNDTGALIVSFPGPLYRCIERDLKEIERPKLSISNIINTASESGLYVDKMFEEETSIEDNKYETNSEDILIYKIKKKGRM